MTSEEGTNRDEKDERRVGDVGSETGVVLPVRRASVTMGRGASLTGDQDHELAGERSSLEDTRSFYGLHPLSPHSSSSHKTFGNNPSNNNNTNTKGPLARPSSSKLSITSRPTSPDSTFSTSPSRTSIPLPLSRAFLSPKKPKAAIKAEEREREKRQQKLESGPTGPKGLSNGVSGGQIPLVPAETHIQGEEIGETSITHALAKAETSLLRGIDSNQTLSTTSHQHEVEIPSKVSEQDLRERPISQQRDETSEDLGDFLKSPPPPGSIHHRYSATEASSPVRPAHELSSEALFRPSNESNNEDDHNHDQAEKGSLKDLNVGSRKRSKSNVQNQKPKAKENKRQRKYQTFENPLTTWFCGGYLMTGGDNYLSFCLAGVLILGITGVWMGTTGVWLWENGSEYGLARGGGVAIVVVFVYLFGLTISSLLVSAFRDPGIIPRGLDPDPPSTQEGSYWEPLDREFAVKKGRVVVRYCETCGTYRPPRSSHCRLCGNCVDGIDHHCSYLHNCVGKRTYLSFLTLLVSSAISCVYTVVFSAIHFSLLCHHDSISFRQAIQESPGAAVSFLLGILALPGVLFLLTYHARLLLYNLTTVEQIRASASKNLLKARKRPDNPFAEDSVLSNILLASLARPQFPSWVGASDWVNEERRLVNPALTDRKWWAWEPPR